jgi:murein biosynthesis integral membrane protein MurJ
MPSQPLNATAERSAAVRLQSVNKNIFRVLLSLASAALLIRVAGMLNQIVVSGNFGAGAVMDSYFVASILPLSMAQLVISAIEASVIPAYARVHTQDGRKQTSALFSTLLNVLLVGTVLLTVVMLFFHQQLIIMLAPGLDAFRTELASSLFYLIVPAFGLMVIIGFLECILNMENQFGLPAYAGMLVPLTTAVFVLALGKSLGILILCVGMVLGLCIQLVVFILRIRHTGLSYRPTINLHNPEVRATFIVAWPALLSAFLLGQANPVVDQIFASSLPAGSISAINYSLKLVSVPAGVIFTSAGRAMLPYLSRQASIRDMKAIKETVRLYFWILGIGTTVLALFMILLAHPIVQILFQRGAFTAEDTNLTAITLTGFLIGLTPLALSFLTTKAFSALGKTHMLMRISIFSMIANAVFDYIFARWWQSFGIALATSAVYFCAVIIQFFVLQRIIGKLDLFVLPHDIVNVASAILEGINKYYARWLNWKGEHLARLRSVRKQIVRSGLVVAVFTAGAIGVIENSLYTLRVAFGSVVMLVLLRYHFVLLLAWVFINAINGLPAFRGSSILIGLTIPTLLSMAYLPTKETLKRMSALIFLLVYLLWMFAGIGISPVGVVPFLNEWVFRLNDIAISVLVINILTTRRRLTGLIDAILLVSTCIALYGIYGYIIMQNGGSASTTSFRISSIFDAITTLAIFLSLVIPLALYRTLTLQGFKCIVGSMVTIILLVALGLTFTRSALISVPLGIMTMILCLPSRKMKIRLLGGFLALAIITVLLETVGHVPIFARFFQPDVATLNGRTDLWQALLANLDLTKLLGNGFGASDVLLTRLQVQDINGLIDVAPHNILLSTLYEQGVIGAILITLVFVSLAVNIISGMRKTTGGHRLLFVTVLAAFVSVFPQSLDSNNFWTQVFIIYFWIVMALPFAVCCSTPEQLPQIYDETFAKGNSTINRDNTTITSNR